MASKWRYVPASEFCTSVRDGTHDSPKPVEHGRFLVTSRHIVGGRLDLGHAYLISQEDFDEINRRSKVDQWDVLLSMIGTVGEPCLIKDEPNFAIKNVGLFKSRGETEGKWLYYYLRSPVTQQLIQEHSRGTTQQYVPLNALRELPVIVPDDDDEMHLITHILSSLDDKIELNLRINESLGAIARALFEKLKNASGGSKKLDDLVEINSWILTKHDELDPIEYIEISEVSRGNLANTQVFQRGKEPSRARRRLRHGDTVLSTVRPDRRAYFLCLNPSPNLIASTGFAVVSPIGAPWSFIHAALTQGEVFDYLGQQADGGAYPAVRPEIIGKLEVPWPTESSVIEEFHQGCAPLYELAEHNRRESRTLATLRDTLLPKLLTGEIRSESLKYDNEY
jgi:type I restriction enzyme S subunit